uniref:Uncharacterized protein n=1 Tax=Zonotrichia albicollis TaxID=44394 RepID=A0A8D2M7F0_ZONAL
VLFSGDLVLVALMSLLPLSCVLTMPSVSLFRISPEEKQCPTFLFCYIPQFEMAVLHSGPRIPVDSGHSFNRPASLLLTSSCKPYKCKIHIATFRNMVGFGL